MVELHPGKKQVSLETYRDDPLFPRIERAVTAILADGKVVAPVDARTERPGCALCLLETKALIGYRFR